MKREQAILVDTVISTKNSEIKKLKGYSRDMLIMHRTGKRFIGIEIEKRYFDIACERIEQAQAQMCLYS